jgi:hypothetical protein
MQFEKYLPAGAFALFTLRLVIFGASVGDALALFAIVGICAFVRYLEHIKLPPITEQLAQDVKTLKDQMAAIKIGNTLRGR